MITSARAGQQIIYGDVSCIGKHNLQVILPLHTTILKVIASLQKNEMC